MDFTSKTCPHDSSFPNLTPESAMKRFRNWLRINERLKKLVSKKIRYYTPKQVGSIIEEIGEPFDNE
jgi:hypothetical protein